MRLRILSIAIAGLLAGVAARADTFRCPGGARDSGVTPNQVVRWCAVEKNGRLTYHGPVWRWHRNGQLMAKEHFVDGELDGEVPSWWESGQPASLGTFRNGERVGVWRFWDQEGSVTHEIAYGVDAVTRDDLYPSGKRRASGAVRDGGKVGLWLLFHEDGRERARCDFGDGLFVLRPEDHDCRLIAEEVEPVGFARPRPRGDVAEDGTAKVTVGPQTYAFTPPAGWLADPDVGAREGLPLVFLPYAATDLVRRMTVRPVLKEGRTLQAVVYEERKAIAERVGDYEEFLFPPRRGRFGRVEASTYHYTRMTRPGAPFAVVEGERVLEAVAHVDVSPELVLVVSLTSDWRVPTRDWMPSFLGLIESVRQAEPPAATPAPGRPPS